MSKILSPTPVLAGMLEACRDWRQWLMGLDAIPEVNGITGLVTSNCHWLAFCRRKDLPIDIAAQYGDLTEQGLVSAPGDIMCLVKEFMSDSALSQKPFCLIRSGSSNLLPDPGGPQHWEPRKEFERDDKKDLQRLCGKIRKVLPLRSAAASYIEEWMSKPRTPCQPPQALRLLSHRCSQAKASFGPALANALQNHNASEDQLGVLVVRRRRQGSRTDINMPLSSWVSFRVTQGVSVEYAVEEWNGWQLAACAQADRR